MPRGGATALITGAALAGSLHAQALPFHTETALTTAFEERGLRGASVFVRRDHLTATYVQLEVLPFAPHQRLVTAVSVPLVSKRLTDGDGTTRFSQTGLGDIAVGAKWAFFVRDRPGGTTRLAVVGSVHLPTGSTDARAKDGEVAPRPLQLGSGGLGAGGLLVATVVRGRWALSADIGNARSAESDGYRFGPVTRYDLAAGVRFPGHVASVRTRTLQVYLEWNGRVSGRDRSGGADVADTGGHVAFLGPGLQWVLFPQLLIEGSLQFPVAQDLNGSQPDFELRAGLGARFLFF